MPDEEDSASPGGLRPSPRRGQSFRNAPGYAELLRQVDTLKRRVITADAHVKDVDARAAAQAAHFDRKLKELTQRLIETEVAKSEMEARLKAMNADPQRTALSSLQPFRGESILMRPCFSANGSS